MPDLRMQGNNDRAKESPARAFYSSLRFLLICSLLSLTSCYQTEAYEDAKDSERIKEILKNNPDVLNDAIRAHPVEVMDAVQAALQQSKKELVKKRREKEKRRLKHYYQDPLDVKIRGDEAYKGKWDASIVLVTYSDFQCPYCRQGSQTVNLLLDEYDGDIVYIFKHLPLHFHDQGMKAARFFEAIRLHSRKRAMKFHDYLFQHQQQLRRGKEFLYQAAESVGMPISQLKENLGKDIIQNRINADMREAKEFGIKGTPGFILNGVPIKGAYPKERFIQIVEELKTRGRLDF